MAAALTPARLRVLTSAAEGHIVRDRYNGDSHITPPGAYCRCEMRPYQRAFGQVEWLESAGLIELVDGRTWRPTSAGLAALCRNPS